MPVTTLLPSGAGAYQEFTSDAGSVPTNVQTKDGTSSYRNTNTDGNADTFICDDLPSTGVGKITLVDLILNSNGAFGDVDAQLRIRSATPTDLDSSTFTVSGAFKDYNKAFALDADGNEWTRALVDAHQYGYQCVTANSNHMRATFIAPDVTWTVAPVGFALFVASWLPPLIAAASHGLMRREVVEILSRLKTRPSSAEDFAALEAAFRVRPIFMEV